MATTSGRFAAYVHEVWQCRYFWTAMAMNDLRFRYRRSIFGVGWSLLNPIAMTAVLCIAFHRIFDIDINAYAPFLLAGMAVWTFISAIVTDGCLTFFRSEGYIRSHAAPLAIYPMRTVLSVAIHFLLTLLLTVVAAGLFNGMGPIGPLVWLIPNVLMLLLFGWAIAVLAGFANAYFPDTQHLSTIGLQILFYLTPILYPSKLMDERGLSNMLRYNPLGALVDLIREPIISGRMPSLSTYLISGVMTGVLVALAIYVLARFQNYLVFQL